MQGAEGVWGVGMMGVVGNDGGLVRAGVAYHAVLRRGRLGYIGEIILWCAQVARAGGFCAVRARFAQSTSCTLCRKQACARGGVCTRRPGEADSRTDAKKKKKKRSRGQMHTHTLTSGRCAAPLVGCAPAAQAMHCEAPVACCMYPSGHVVQDVDPLLAANVPSCGGCTNSGSTARVSEAVGEAMIGTLGKAGWAGQAGAVGELRAVGGARAREHAMWRES